MNRQLGVEDCAKLASDVDQEFVAPLGRMGVVPARTLDQRIRHLADLGDLSQQGSSAGMPEHSLSLHFARTPLAVSLPQLS